MELRRIDPLSCAKIAGILYGIVGLLFGALFSLISILGMTQGPDAGLLGLIGIAAVLVLPLFYGLLGAVSAGLGALLYNLIARSVGGIKLELS